MTSLALGCQNSPLAFAFVIIKWLVPNTDQPDVVP